MGKFFGSRLVERQTNDRIYDDKIKNGTSFRKKKVVAFVSIEKHNKKFMQQRKYLEKF